MCCSGYFNIGNGLPRVQLDSNQLETKSAHIISPETMGVGVEAQFGHISGCAMFGQVFLIQEAQVRPRMKVYWCSQLSKPVEGLQSKKKWLPPTADVSVSQIWPYLGLCYVWTTFSYPGGPGQA